jgi:hypothetical protein
MFVSEKHERRLAKLCRDLGTEVGEDAEVGFECLGDVEVVAVASTPSERPTGRTLEARQVDSAPFQRLEFVHRVVVADDADELHRHELRRSGREEGRGPAQHLVGFAEGGFDGVQRDGAYNEEGHWVGARC